MGRLVLLSRCCCGFSISSVDVCTVLIITDRLMALRL
jgi:hypothetical protein